MSRLITSDRIAPGSPRIINADAPQEKKTRQSLSKRQKLAIVYKSMQTGKQQVGLAQWAKEKWNLRVPPPQSTISEILSKRDDFLAMTDEELDGKRKRLSAYPSIEKALARFVDEMEREGLPISRESLRDQAKAIGKALKITDFEFSDAGSAVTNNQDVQTRIAEIRNKINEYGLSNVYNFDETALFYAQVPRRTISKTPLSGQKDDKTRITIALASKPRCFGGKTGEQHGHWYWNNRKAWMTAELFALIMRRFDITMGNLNNKVLLLIDNAPSHKVPFLKNVEIMTLPPNTTSVYQPLDAGIIAAFKKQYRATQYRTAGQKYRNHQLGQIYDIDQLTAMRWARNAWEGISQETITSCWVKTGLLNFETEQERAVKEAAAEADQRLSDELDALLAEVHNDSSGIQSIELIPDEESNDIHAPVLVDGLTNNVIIDIDTDITTQEEEQHDQQERHDQQEQQSPIYTRKEQKEHISDFLKKIVVDHESDLQ
ncbi:hypothetical protein INT45_004235, partial [Circinella minor]